MADTLLALPPKNPHSYLASASGIDCRGNCPIAFGSTAINSRPLPTPFIFPPNPPTTFFKIPARFPPQTAITNWEPSARSAAVSSEPAPQRPAALEVNLQLPSKPTPVTNRPRASHGVNLTTPKNPAVPHANHDIKMSYDKSSVPTNSPPHRSQKPSNSPPQKSCQLAQPKQPVGCQTS
jgi:hypothetical protein